jgi:hypothetical protein
MNSILSVIGTKRLRVLKDPCIQHSPFSCEHTTLFFAFSVVLHLMLLLLILPATLSTNHSKHVETSYIVLQVDI